MTNKTKSGLNVSEQMLENPLIIRNKTDLENIDKCGSNRTKCKIVKVCGGNMSMVYWLGTYMEEVTFKILC